MISVPYTLGTLYSFGHLDELKKSWVTLPIKTLETARFTGCFDPYWDSYVSASDNNRNKFYFSFPIMPSWILEVVDEFNSRFSNIKIEVIDNRVVYGRKISKSLGSFLEVTTIKNSEEDYIFNIPIFTIKYNEEYPKSTTKYTNYLIHHIFRMFSYAEKFKDMYVDEDNRKDYKNYLDMVCTISNRNKRSAMFTRNISDNSVYPHELLLMDNMKYAEIFYSYPIKRVIKQTEIINKFISAKEKVENKKERISIRNYSSQFRVGDFVKYIPGHPDGNKYSITNDRMILGQVVEVNSDHVITIIVLKHEQPIFVNEESYPVASQYFYRVDVLGRKARDRK